MHTFTLKRHHMLSIAAISLSVIGMGAVHAKEDPQNISEEKGSSEEKESTALGKPENCINTRHIRTTKIIDASTIDFRMIGGKTYRNKVRGACLGTGKTQRIISYRTTSSRLCRPEIIHVFDNIGGSFSPRGACGLGKFQLVLNDKSEKK